MGRRELNLRRRSRACYAKAVESQLLASEARQALNFTLYCIDEQGRPRDLPQSQQPGGWQEDAHTDVIHNYVDALQRISTMGMSDVADVRSFEFRREFLRSPR